MLSVYSLHIPTDSIWPWKSCAIEFDPKNVFRQIILVEKKIDPPPSSQNFRELEQQKLLDRFWNPPLQRAYSGWTLELSTTR